MTKESKTLFIRNLPYSVGNNDLEGYFSEYGPIKRCFVVQDNVTGKSRGIGYVTYTLREDATKANDSKHRLEGRPIHVAYADITRKVKKGKRKKKAEEEEDEDADGGPEVKQEEEAGVKEEAEKQEDEDFEVVQSDDKPEEKSKDVSPAAKKTGVKYHKAKIVLLSGLPEGATDSTLGTCLQKLNVKSAAEYKMVGEKQAHVKFKCIRDAKKAIRKLHNQTYTDCMLQASQLSNVSKGQNSSMPQTEQRQSRVIIRNLSFKCKEEDLGKAFDKCGEITEVKLPTNTEGKVLGFGFIQFTTVSEAAQAIEMMNATKIMGRPVAVDWAIPKKTFQMIHSKKDEESDDDDESDNSGSESNSDMSSGEEEEEKTAPKTKQKHTKFDDSSSDDDEEEEATTSKTKQKVSKLQESDESSSEEDDDDDDEMTEELGGAESKGGGSGSDDDDDDEDDDDDDDEEDDEEDDDEDEEGSSSKKNAKKNEKSDCDEGQTIFIRNLAFNCDEAQLQEYFEQFGELVYAKVVVDQNTEHSRGMGFVKYASKASADKCLGKATNTNLVLQGRVLSVTLAVSRNKAATFQQKEKKEKKDARNLHLAREGMIRPGTQDAIGLAKADLDKRMKVENVKRQKLKNINVFISPLRLCVRNIPVNVDEKQLKKVFHEAAGQKAAKVTECRIMRDRARVNTEGVAKSQGFGFVSFAEHQHALTALRSTNNNPDVFGEKRRLIVEFSLENKRALEAKEKRKARAQAKQQQFKAKAAKAGDKGPQQQGPGEKGRQWGPGPRGKPGQNKGGKPGKSPSVASLQLSDKDRQAKGDKPLPKGLPSHWGPKVRHKPRPGPQKPGKKGRDNRPPGGRDNRPPIKQPKTFKRPADRQSEGPPLKRRKRTKQEHDSFDKLVNKYKNRISDRTKWFEK